MYNPRHFELDHLPTMHALMRAHPFALFITQHQGELHLTHAPVHLEAARGERGTLEAHFAKPNAHCAAMIAGAETTVVFRGPDAYISPRWYVDPQKNVPTWNYAAVHAHGKPIAHTDEETKMGFIERLTDEHEAYIEDPWSVREAQAYANALSKGVVAFELPIDRLEGKLKLSQNRIPEDRLRVMNQLRKSPQNEEMIRLMDALYKSSGETR